ncbi:SRPBCC domain-containing protein [Frondihabitans peucedani]|uniref:SRPBCC domain-containing protein n=1 Tax=Frondihabitans peucedani TaxID=598626 RepID=A0ABP8E135_9MICO
MTTTLESTVDADALTLTFVAEFDAAPDRVWQLWVDPRQLERWWGPPTWPATFVEHDPTPGGVSKYFMTGPDGTRSAGWWRFVSLTPPESLVFEDGFATEAGELDDSLPTTRTSVTLAGIDGGDTRTRMTTVTRFTSADELEKLLQMGMREGMTEAMGQIEAILAG